MDTFDQINNKISSALASRKYYEKMKNDIEYMNIKKIRATEYKQKLRDIKNAEKIKEIQIEKPEIIEPKKRGRPRKY